MSDKQQHSPIQNAVEQLVAAIRAEGSGTPGSWEEIEKKLVASESFRGLVREEASAAGGQDATKEALGDVIQSVLFESGILEKLVSKQVETKLAAGSGGGSPEGVKQLLAKELPAMLQSEIKAIAERQVRTAMAGEEMKALLDEKFRAMSLYLKTDVIPRAVQKSLKDGQPAT